MEVDIRKYDMENAVMKKVNQKLLELQVSLNSRMELNMKCNLLHFLELFLTYIPCHSSGYNSG